MSTTTAFRVHGWIKNWEDELKNPDDLLFYMTIGNVSDYLLDIIDSNPKQNPFTKESYEIKLLFLLDRLFATNGTEPKLIKKHRPTAVNKLQSESTTLQTQVSNSQRLTPNIKKIRNALHAINGFYNGEHFIKEIENEIVHCIKNDPNSTDMRVATFLLLRSLITKHSHKFLMDLPKILFSKGFFGDQSSSVIKKVLESKEAVAEFDKYVTRVIKSSHSKAKKYSGPKKSKKLAEFIIERDLMMRNSSYWVVQRAREFLRNNKQFKNISTLKTREENLEALDKSLEDISINNSIDDLLQYCMDHVCSLIIYQCIGHYDPLKAESKIKKHKFDALYSDIFKRKVFGKDYETSVGFNHPILEATFYTVKKTYASYVSTQLLKRRSRSEKRRLVSIIRNAIKKEINEPSDNYFQNKRKVVDKVANSFNFVKSVDEFIQDAVTRNMSPILGIIQNTKPSSILKNKKETLEHQSELFSKELSKSIYYRNQIPYELEPKKAIKLFNKFFKEIRTKKKFRVFCLIGDLNCNGRAFRLGGVSFYDARKWEFGEGEELDSGYDSFLSSDQKFLSDFETYIKIPLTDGKVMERKKNSGRAYVDVTSADQGKAIEDAVSKIREALPTLVYASSAYGHRGGFQPLLPSHYAVLQKEGHSGSMGRGNTPRRLEVNEEYDRIIKFYDQFLTEKNTRYDESILKSFTWFQKGRREIIPHEKFLAYWIAVEQLILTNTKWKTFAARTPVPGHKKRLLRHMPRLSVTWRDSGESWVISRFLKEIVPMITQRSSVGKYLHSNPERRRWKENNAILLENLPQLKSRSGKKQLRETVERLQDHLSNNIKSIIAECTLKLQNQKFKVARLYEKRNLVIHEGSINDDELILMTKSLERLLLDVLRPILEFREGRTINQIIKEANRPYSLREKKII